MKALFVLIVHAGAFGFDSVVGISHLHYSKEITISVEVIEVRV